MADEGPLAEAALIRFGGAAHVGPSVQLEVPLRSECFATYHADVGAFAAVGAHVGLQVRPEVHLGVGK